MAASAGFSGMQELIAGLGQLSATVQAEAGDIVLGAAVTMSSDVKREYGTGPTGNLAARVVVEKAGPLRVKVRTKAPHAHLYEFGTVQRFTHGTGANRGTMPAKPVFVPAAVRTRKRMVDDLKDLVRRQRVRGMTGTLEVRDR